MAHDKIEYAFIGAGALMMVAGTAAALKGIDRYIERGKKDRLAGVALFIVGAGGAVAGIALITMPYRDL